MANRSYLYTVNFNQNKRFKKTKDAVFGLSESEYNIPLVYKILVSPEVEMCKSLIWDNEQQIALTGNIEKGKIKLFDFLTSLQSKRFFDAQLLNEKIDNAKIALSKTQHYGLLEAGEIYDMENENISCQNIQLYNSLKNIDNEINQFYKDILEIEMKLEKLKIGLIDLKVNDDFLGKIIMKLLPKKKIATKDNIQKLENSITFYEQQKWALLGIDNWKEHLYYNF